MSDRQHIFSDSETESDSNSEDSNQPLESDEDSHPGAGKKETLPQSTVAIATVNGHHSPEKKPKKLNEVTE